MVMRMNKTEFINSLEKELSYSREQCLIINEILEHHFFFNQKEKDKIMGELIQRLQIESKEASNVYDRAITILKDEMKYRLRHPFGK